jgi:hypothetical protein
MPIPNDLFAQLKAKHESSSDEVPSTSATSEIKKNRNQNNALLTQLLSNKQPPKLSTTNHDNNAIIGDDAVTKKDAISTKAGASVVATTTTTKIDFQSQSFVYDETIQSFLFAVHHGDTNKMNNDNKKDYLSEPSLIPDMYQNDNTNIVIPLAPCIYRMTDYTYSKKEPITLHRCILKLGVLRCFQRECHTINTLLWNRYHTLTSTIPMEEDEIGKIRFMELLSNCGIYQKVSELLVKQIIVAIDYIKKQQLADDNSNDNNKDDNKSNEKEKKQIFNNRNPYRVPQIQVDGLNEFLQQLNQLYPSLQIARNEINMTQTVSFYPGLGELFTPGSKLTCYPEGK